MDAFSVPKMRDMKACGIPSATRGGTFLAKPYDWCSETCPNPCTCVETIEANIAAERTVRQDRALNAALLALIQLSKTGSLHKEIREATIQQIKEALNERLF